ncbi:MAG: methyltransferase [Magnetococcales bacterium]|nr:methyltransferase [Magnetococcales bacterium]
MNPQEIIRLANGFRTSQVILTAHHLGVFAIVGEELITAFQVAEQTGGDPRGMAMLLDALSALGLLTKEEHRYRHTPLGLKHLHPSGEAYMGASLTHLHDLSKVWSLLGEAVIQGGSVRPPEKNLLEDPETNRGFIQAMAQIGRPNARIIAETLDFSPYHRLLDLGGGPGTYAMEILRRNPQITGVVVDLPLTLEVAREEIAKEGFQSRLALHPVDFFNDTDSSLGEGFDVALISNVLHVEGVEANRNLLKRTHQAMAAGGMLVIHETLIDETRTRHPDRALFALNMLLNTERGDCYSFEEIHSWLLESGFHQVEFIDCFELPSLMTAIKKN